MSTANPVTPTESTRPRPRPVSASLERQADAFVGLEQLAATAAGRHCYRVPTYQIRPSFAAGLHRPGTDLADIRNLYGHTRPETTMIYAPLELEQHRAALERLRRDDGARTP